LKNFFHPSLEGIIYWFIAKNTKAYKYKVVLIMDRALRGLIAGFVGAVAMNLWSLFSYYVLNFSDRLFYHWSSILVFARTPESFAEVIVALIFQVMWTSTFGVIFAFLIPVISSRAYILKGAVFGFLLSFIFYVLPMLFNIPALFGYTLGNVTTEMVGGTIWGTIMAITLAYYSKNFVTV
jgi:hypothetical protein